RGQAVGAVGAGVLLVAAADRGGVEQADGGGQDLAARQAGRGEVRRGAGADARRGLAEGDYPPVLGLVAGGPPLGVVAVLLAAPGVPTDDLEVAPGVRADADGGPGRPAAQRADE